MFRSLVTLAKTLLSTTSAMSRTTVWTIGAGRLPPLELLAAVPALRSWPQPIELPGCRSPAP
jgi:hypothetical protein